MSDASDMADRPSTARPRLLFLSPVLPAESGNGVAMRAAMVLRLLARHYDVWLLVVSLYRAPPRATLDAMADVCQESAIFHPRRGGGVGQALPFHGLRFDVVHVFRLITLPFASPYFIPPSGHRPRRHLDLDDIESATRGRIAALHRDNGEERDARREEAQAARAARLENDLLARFDRVYVCSDQDRQALEQRAPGRVFVLPNALPSPPISMAAAPLDMDPFTLLFVGTLDYYPNFDAVRLLCREVLAELRTIATTPVILNVVGDGGWSRLRELTPPAEARLIGAVADLDSWYRDAHAVIVPLRAGGGTRIKVLEAFRAARAVIATSIGMEGIDARPDQHFLLADSPAALARQCLRLMTEPGLISRLGAQAFDLFSSAYSTEAVTRTYGPNLAPPDPPESPPGGGSLSPR